MLAHTFLMLALAQGPVPARDPVDAALAWVRRLDAGGFDSAAAQIDAAVPAGVMSADRLRLIWGAITQQYGKLTRLDRGCSFRPRCRFAVDQCAIAPPPLAPAGASGQLSACYRSHELGALSGAAA